MCRKRDNVCLVQLPDCTLTMLTPLSNNSRIFLMWTAGSVPIAYDATPRPKTFLHQLLLNLDAALAIRQRFFYALGPKSDLCHSLAGGAATIFHLEQDPSDLNH